MRPIASLAIAVFLGAVPFSVSGCVPSVEEPDFEAPIQWDSAGAVPGNVESLANLFPGIGVELEPDGSAMLTDFPRGEVGRDQDGYLCTEVSPGESYTGDGEWTHLNQLAVELKFEDSTVVLFGSQGRFQTQDWSEVRVVDCDSGTMWYLGYVCGDLGTEDVQGISRPEDCGTGE